jgi:hypothetical protein
VNTSTTPPQKSRSSFDYVSSFASILAFFTAHSQPLPSLIVDNETSLECRDYFLSQRLPVTFVPPQTHRSNPAERAVRTGKNHFISVFSSTHPDFPDDLWGRLLPYAETILNVMRSWRPDPSLSPWSGFHRLSYDFSAHPIHPPGQLCLTFSDPDHRDTWAPHGDRAFTLGPALIHYRCQRVYVVSSRSERITLTLAHFPLPLFHFAASNLPPPRPPTPLPPFPPLLSKARI